MDTWPHPLLVQGLALLTIGLSIVHLLGAPARGVSHPGWCWRHTPSSTAPRAIAGLPRPGPGITLAELPTVTFRLVALASTLALAVAGSGCDVDCFDEGDLEAAYRDGQRAGAAISAADYERGRGDGLALDRAAGAVDGQAEGRAQGYADGYDSSAGYRGGYGDGHARGWDDGVADPTACKTGGDTGWYEGDAAGADAAWQQAWSEAHEDGYDAGWYAGEACTNRAVQLAPTPTEVEAAPAPTQDEVEDGDVRTCYRRGFASTSDEDAYGNGLAAGKRDNPEYQTGYREAYPRGHADGVHEGVVAGYDAGMHDGYSAGYTEGYDQIYGGCYQLGYDDGYASGWNRGWAAGWDAGWAAGYEAGFAEAVARCP